VTKHAKDASHITELLKVCSLCHSSMPREHSKLAEESKTDQQYSTSRMNHDFKSINKFDQAQLNFANSFKYGFVGRKGQVLTIQAGGKKE
jgi:hypothetical protein